MNYVIVKRKLDSDNEFLLDELTLGRKVASQEAVSLPIKEAISLLKDRRGEIKLKVPVSGDLGNPRFHPGRIIWKTVKSLISKAVTSPFTVLASLVDWHGETLNFVKFPYGSADITQQAGAKLDELAKALYERPNLNLDVEGYVSPEHDRQALREKYFKRKLKIQKLKEMTRNGRSGLSLGQVRIERDEYQKYLKMAYESEISREKSGGRHDVIPDASRSQMEDYLLSQIHVGDEGLRLLAQKRASSVRKYILNGSDITPDRIFIVAPESLAPTEKPGESDSRAVMAIR